MVFYWTDGFGVFLSVREGQFIGDRGLGLLLRIYSGKSEIIRHSICQFRPKFLKTFFLFLEVHAALHSRTASLMI